MVGTHQLIVALSPPTHDQWTERLSLELARSQLFCLLSVVGEQASNIGKELLGRWQSQAVLSSEAVFNVLSEYAQVSADTGVRISCAVIVFRGSRTTVAGLRAGVSLRRDSLARAVIQTGDVVEIREGSCQPQDLYILHTELSSHQAEELLSQSVYPTQLLKQWRVSQVDLQESATGAEGLAIGMVLPNQLLETSVGKGFLEDDQALELGGVAGGGSFKGTEKNLLQQRRDSRNVAKVGWGQKLKGRFLLLKSKLARKTTKSVSAGSVVVESAGAESTVAKSLIAESTDAGTQSAKSTVAKSLVAESTDAGTQSAESTVANSSTVVEADPSTKPTAPPDSVSVKVVNKRGLATSLKNMGSRLKSRNSVFVGHHVNRKRLIIIVGSILLLIALLFGVGYMRQSRLAAEQVAMEQLLPYQGSLDSMRALGETDPVSARTQAQSQLAELGSLQVTGNLPSTAKSELDRLLDETKTLYESLAVVSDLTALPLYDDLRRLSPSFLASTAAGEGSQGILADREQQLLVAYTATDKSGQLLDAANLEKVIAVTQVGERSYVLGDGVWSLSSPSATELNQVIQPATQTEGATLIASFGSNVYVFNPTQRALFRYAESGSSFGSPSNWLTGAAPFTFTDVSSVVVDGEVWFGSNQGQIYRFVGGKQADFTVTGLDQPPSSSVYLATDPESELMAVLEPAGKRLIILNKATGLVSREFVNPNLGAATGLWLDEANNQVLVSSGAALYNILIDDSAV